MAVLSDLFQTGDFKAEKHVPVIDVPEKVVAGAKVKVTVSVGKEIAHPNTTAHHISWLEVYFLPDGAKFPVQVGRYDLVAHGASAEGADKGPVYSDPEVTFSFKTSQSGTLLASSYCNIHGLWQSKVDIKVG